MNRQALSRSEMTRFAVVVSQMICFLGLGCRRSGVASGPGAYSHLSTTQTQPINCFIPQATNSLTIPFNFANLRNYCYCCCYLAPTSAPHCHPQSYRWSARSALIFRRSRPGHRCCPCRSRLYDSISNRPQQLSQPTFIISYLVGWLHYSLEFWKNLRSIGCYLFIGQVTPHQAPHRVHPRLPVPHPWLRSWIPSGLRPETIFVRGGLGRW